MRCAPRPHGGGRRRECCACAPCAPRRASSPARRSRHALAAARRCGARACAKQGASAVDDARGIRERWRVFAAQKNRAARHVVEAVARAPPPLAELARGARPPLQPRVPPCPSIRRVREFHHELRPQRAGIFGTCHRARVLSGTLGTVQSAVGLAPIVDRDFCRSAGMTRKRAARAGASAGKFGSRLLNPMARFVRSWSLLCVCRARAASSRPRGGPRTARSRRRPGPLTTSLSATAGFRRTRDGRVGAHLVTSLPGLPRSFSSKQWAGLLPVEDGGSDGPGALFYWLFEADNGTHRKSKDGKAPLIIW